jgi:hypothetical protein
LCFASRLTASQIGFFILSQSGERPERVLPLRHYALPELAGVAEDGPRASTRAADRSDASGPARELDPTADRSTGAAATKTRPLTST